MFKKKNLAAALCAVLLAVPAVADTVIGEGRAPLGAGNASAVRNVAKQEAVRDAVLKAIKDATALDASGDRFAGIVGEVAKQVQDIRVMSEEAVGNDFLTRVQVNVDRKQIKNAIRGTELDKLNDRSFSILMLVDEFVTSTRDLNLPLEELTEFKYDAGSSFRDKSIKANAASASSSSAAAYSGSINAASAQSARLDASSQGSLAAASPHGSLHAADRSAVKGSASSSSSLSAKENYAAAASAKSASSAVDARNVAANSHETASYKHLVKYQDTSKPTNRPMFLGEFAGRLRDYDLRLLDSSNARSQFFGNKPINLALLANGAEMTKFSEFARTKANADFLLMGSSTVVAGDYNSATGAIGCVVNAEVKAFATAGGEVIASIADSAQASGPNIEGCAAVASKKIADLMAPVFASGALGYWADRSARGRQYTVEFKGTNLALPMRMAFAKALRDIDGATAVEKKEDGPDGVKVTLTLKGKGDAMEQVYGAVSGQAAFAGKSLDGTVNGEMVTLCLDKCGGTAKPAAKKR
ncbi:hypothetical protein GJV26_18820 [Massilia dura]|uniref:Flagellar assembly protein T N-terminal domain-containing protein n=1 Tax=Pseudoduganella dura TaxID=321982 RepID=A0A6I3XC36_9BURK|nr:hypothetical protein [Pseudoduganella dura]MUI14494.1 hypothetical protein [Pseudoduganella dura]GGY13873.1 hypothetical protein GCM10007386_50100 [Pseudoduganella dura]